MESCFACSLPKGSLTKEDHQRQQAVEQEEPPHADHSRCQGQNKGTPPGSFFWKVFFSKSVSQQQSCNHCKAGNHARRLDRYSKQLVAAGDAPIEEWWFVVIGFTIQNRDGQIARCQHFTRDIGIPCFIWLQQRHIQAGQADSQGEYG